MLVALSFLKIEGEKKMKQETREERIKRLLEARESGTLEEVTSAKPISIASEVPEKEEEDWEDESRLISSKNQERIKEASQKTAELASQSAKAATKIAEQGVVKGVAMMKAIKERMQEKKQEKAKDTESKSYEAYEKFRRREVKRFADRVDAEAADPDSPHISNSRFRDRLEEIIEEQQERSVDESEPERVRQDEGPLVTPSCPSWLTPKLAVMVVGLIVAGIGIAWFVRYERSPDSITQTPVDAPTPATPEVIQVMPVEAILPPSAPTPPTQLPPLPETTPVAVEPSATNPVAAAPVAPKPQKAVQVASSAKTQSRPTAPKEKEAEWQKDASKKLDEWGF